MPLLPAPKYLPPPWLFNAHLETAYPAVFRHVEIHHTVDPVTIETSDGDIIDLDYYQNKSADTVIISHGLEGNSRRPYVLGMVKIFLEHGWNVIAWNFRGCNGKPNKTARSYHSGATEDLEEVIRFADTTSMERIALIGFSLGGNLTLKYLGDPGNVNKKVISAVVFSVPVDLHRSCVKISEWSNYIYSRRFLKSLKKKIIEKSTFFPEVDPRNLTGIKDLMTFDDRYTAPLHGFKDAMDYYRKCSALYLLDQITIPTLMINALNDPFLSDSCFPCEIAKNNPYFHLQMPRRGGHVGFALQNIEGKYWSEIRALEFIQAKH